MTSQPEEFAGLAKSRTYSNPTIAEALCEIHFESASSIPSDIEAILKSLKDDLRPEYPSATEQVIKQYHAAISDIGISVNEDKSNTSRLIFKHRERNHLIQVLPNLLSINELAKYPGWDVFSQDALRGWNALNKAFSKIHVKRVGLRYINLIPKQNFLEPLSVWLQKTKYYPDAILENTTGFLARGEFNLNKTLRLIVSISEPLQQEQNGQIIFDIDVISVLDQQMDWTVISNRLNELHAVVWDVFSSSLTTKYEALLNGEFL